jgi:hypothetical protein
MQLNRAIFLLILCPFVIAAKGAGCSGDEPIGSNNPPSGAISNPTGTCVASGLGGHECYSVPDPSSQWMLDCDHPLQRTYWRVYAFSEQSAHMLPRPDGTGLTFGTCDGPDEALFQEYGLCDESLGPDGVEKINDMPLADALALSHVLHGQLSFEADLGPEGWSVAPWVLPEDLTDACPVAVTNSGDAGLQQKCDDYLAVVCGATNIGVSLDIDETQAVAIAEALNQIYGI